MSRAKLGPEANTESRKARSLNLPVPLPVEINEIELGRVRKAKSELLGLDIVTAGGDGVPYFELRLHLVAGSALEPRGSAVPRMLSSTFLGGTSTRSAEEISRALQRMGSTLSCSIGVDGAVVSASGLAHEFDGVLELLAEVIFSAEYPAEEVEVSRARVMQDLAVARAQPSTIARDHLRKAIYGEHPYGEPTPPPSAAAQIARDDIRRFHERVFRARGGRFVVISSLGHQKVVRSIRRYFECVATPQARSWRRSARALYRPTRDFTPRAILVDRPGSVQTSIRIAMPAPSRDDPLYHAFLVANTIFGGYFSSRLVENVRETKGYAYGISSSVSHKRMSSTVTVATDVATEVTAPALVEIFYEIEKARAAPPTADEIEAARRCLLGSTAISLDTYGGLAASLDSLYDCGMDEKYLRDLKKRLWSLCAEEIYEAGCVYLDRAKAVTVLVGDASRTEKALRNILGGNLSVMRGASDV